MAWRPVYAGRFNSREAAILYVGERGEDDAKEIIAFVMKHITATPFSMTISIAEIVQRAMDDDYDDRMQDGEDAANAGA